MSVISDVEAEKEAQERMESFYGDVNASPCEPDVTSPSRSGCGPGEPAAMPPQEKLTYYERRAQDREENDQFDACLQDLVRCVALTRLAHGEDNLKLAQAHARLAKAYLQFKGWGLQAHEHTSLAREMLAFCSAGCCSRDEKLEVLLSVHLTHGAAALLIAQLEEAESSYLQAKQVIDELLQIPGSSPDERIETELEILSGLSRVYKRHNRLEEALKQCEKSLQLLRDFNKPEKECSVYRAMAAIEQDRGNLDGAVAHLSKAHAIAMSHSPMELEGAQIAHTLALILSAAAQPQHSDSAGHYFEQSLISYKNAAGPQDPEFLTAQDDFCRFLLLTGNEERCVEIQRASLPSKRSAFGDSSAEVADTLQLIGSVEMTNGRMYQAHRYMAKCLEIQHLLFGPKHKKTKTTQKAVDMLARAPEVVDRLQKQSTKKSQTHSHPVQ